MQPTSAFKPLTKADIGDVLAVSLRTVENWVSDGTLPPPAKIGNRVFWDPDLFYGWLKLALTTGNPTDKLSTEGESKTVASRKAPSRGGAKSNRSELDALRVRTQSKLDALVAGT